MFRLDAQAAAVRSTPVSASPAPAAAPLVKPLARKPLAAPQKTTAVAKPAAVVPAAKPAPALPQATPAKASTADDGDWESF